MTWEEEKYIKNKIKEGLRYGQAVMEMLFVFDKEFYNEITTTSLDCYYNDDIADKVIEIYNKRRIDNA